MPGSLEKLVFELRADNTKLRKDLALAASSTSSWGSKTRSSVNGVAKAFVAASVAGASALAVIYKNASEAGDQLAKLSDQVGDLPENLSSLQHAAEITGVSTNSFNSSIARMVKRLGEAEQGTGAAKKQLDLLGLSSEEFFSLRPSEQFSAISDQVNSLGSQQEKAAVAAALFGREGLALVNTMSLGSEGLSEMSKEAEALGLTLNRVDLAKMEAANDSFFKARQTTTAFGKQLAVQVAPIVKAISESFTKAAIEAGGFGQYAQTAVSGAVRVLGVFADGIHGIRVVWGGVKAAAYSAFEGIVTGVAWVDEKLADLISSIPGLEREANKSIRSAADSLGQAGAEARESFQSALLQKLPSERLKEFIADAQVKAEVEAKSAAKKALSNVPESVDIPEFELNESSSSNTSFERLKQSLLSEEERIQQSYELRRQLVMDNTLKGSAERASILESIHQQELARKQEIEASEQDAQAQKDEHDRSRLIGHLGQITGIQRGHLETISDLENASNAARFQAATGFLDTIASAVAGKSKKAFNIMKAARISGALVAGGEAAVNAWNAGMSTGGPWAPVVAAGYASASLLKTGGQIANIRSMSFGGGSSGGASFGAGSIPSARVGSGVSSAPDSERSTENEKKVIDFTNYQPESSIKIEDVMRLAEDIGFAVQVSNTSEKAKRRGYL